MDSEFDDEVIDLKEFEESLQENHAQDLSVENTESDNSRINIPKQYKNDSVITNKKKEKQKLKRKLGSYKDKEWIKTEKEEQLMESVFGNKDALIENLEKIASAKIKKSSHKRLPVWHDSDDEEVKVSDVSSKLNENETAAISGDFCYKNHLENKFQKVVGDTPKWADLDNIKEVDSDDEILQTVGHVIKGTGKKLSAKTLEFKKLENLNRATYAEQKITGVEFHPSSCAALVTGLNGVASIYSIDGARNDKLHSMAFKKFSINCARLNRDGSEAVFGSYARFFHTYNLLTGQTSFVKLPPNVSTFKYFEISPCGKYIASADRYGDVHLFDYTSKEIIHTLKQERVCTSLTFSPDSLTMFLHSDSPEVCIFDVRMQRMKHKFFDDGCLNGTSIAISQNGHYMATGSAQGAVNLYKTESVYKNQYPVVEKTFLNLTTSIKQVKFNPASELLGFCSDETYNDIKLANVASGTVYSNFPELFPKLGKLQLISFSPGGGYLAMGNAQSAVGLYRLKHYKTY